MAVRTRARPSTDPADLPRPANARTQVGFSKSDGERDGLVVENRHEPTTVHCKTYLEDRYKLAVYCDPEYGELLDLEDDPGEHCNRWDDPSYRETKQRLIRDLLFAEMETEPLWTPRLAVA